MEGRELMVSEVSICSPSYRVDAWVALDTALDTVLQYGPRIHPLYHLSSGLYHLSSGQNSRRNQES